MENAHTHTTSWYELAAPRSYIFVAGICRANTDPPVTKIRRWASWGVDQDYMKDLIKKIDDVQKKIGHKPGKVLLYVRVLYCNRSGVVELVGRDEGALDVRESRERRDKIVPQKFGRENRKNAILAWNSQLFLYY